MSVEHRIQSEPCVRCGILTQCWQDDKPLHPGCDPKDAAPPEFVKMARAWLYDRAESDKELDALYPPGLPFPEALIEALAREFDAAISDRGGEWVTTLIAGRPHDTPLVEWEARDLIDLDDAKEIAANQGHRYG